MARSEFPRSRVVGHEASNRSCRVFNDFQSHRDDNTVTEVVAGGASAGRTVVRYQGSSIDSESGGKYFPASRLHMEASGILDWC